VVGHHIHSFEADAPAVCRVVGDLLRRLCRLERAAARTASGWAVVRHTRRDRWATGPGAPGVRALDICWLDGRSLSRRLACLSRRSGDYLFRSLHAFGAGISNSGPRPARTAAQSRPKYLLVTQAASPRCAELLSPIMIQSAHCSAFEILRTTRLCCLCIPFRSSLGQLFFRSDRIRLE